MYLDEYNRAQKLRCERKRREAELQRRSEMFVLAIGAIGLMVVMVAFWAQRMMDQ